MRSGSRVAITNSELGTFRSCRQQWHFSYRELLRPRESKRPLAVGSAVHAGLAAMYREIAAVQATHNGPVALGVDRLLAVATDGMKAKLSDHLRYLYERMEGQAEIVDVDRLVAESQATEAEVRSTVERYVATFAADSARYKVLAVEQPFAVPMLADNGRATPRVLYRGVFDLVMFDTAMGDVVLVEHKTTTLDARKAESKLDMDPQTTGYVWSLGRMAALGHLPGLPPDATVGRVFYNVLRKSGPREPKWNADGTLSAAAIDTTRSQYEGALLVQESEGGPRTDGKPRAPKPRTEKQAELLASLPDDASKWIKRHETWHSLDEQQRWRREVVIEGGQIRKSIAGRLPIVRNPGHCNMPWSLPCAYRSICRNDTPEGRALAFKVVGNPHVEVVEAESEGAV